MKRLLLVFIAATLLISSVGGNSVVFCIDGDGTSSMESVVLGSCAFTQTDHHDQHTDDHHDHGAHTEECENCMDVSLYDDAAFSSRDIFQAQNSAAIPNLVATASDIITPPKYAPQDWAHAPPPSLGTYFDHAHFRRSIVLII